VSPRDPPAIEVEGLVKRFGRRRALDGIDLEVRRGEVYGLLGPNGAGKTTLVRVLATLLRPDGGSARVLGHDVVHDAAQVRRLVSLTGQFASVDEDLSGRENLFLLGRLLGLGRRVARARADALLAAFALEDAADRVVKTYSGGMRRRLDVAASILRTPALLFLDEPTTGLDPRSRNRVWDIVRVLAEAGTTVLLTTQYLEEADRLADRIAVVDGGRVIARGTSAELKASVGHRMLRVRVAAPEDRARARAIVAAALGAEVQEITDPHGLTAPLPVPARAQAALHALDQAGIAVAAFALEEPDLDEVFFALTGHGAGGGGGEAA